MQRKLYADTLATELLNMSPQTQDEEDGNVNEMEHVQHKGLGLARAPASYAAAINQDNKDDENEENNEYDLIPGLMTN